MEIKFSADFDWGVATTAIQIEGALAGSGSGRGKSMWPEFARQPGRIKHGDTPAHAGRSYDYLDRDLDALQRLGVKSYNFSASWPRILPQGSGATNAAGIDYYHRLVDGLLERDIQPDLSLYDWDLPLAYSERGGWEQRDLVSRFHDYVDILIREYGDRVTRWMTFNELSTQALNGYRVGNHAPGRQSVQGFLRAYHHLMVAHGGAVQRLRESGDRSISVVDNLLQYYSATVSEADRAATKRQWNISGYYLLDALFRGELNDDFVSHHIRKENANFDHVLPGDLEIISQPFDRFGVNYFTSFIVAADPDDPERKQKISPAPGPQSPFGWTIDPQGLLDALRLLKKDYTHDLPIFIGECGIGQVDYPSPDGSVKDPERIDYLYLHLEKVYQAIQEGIPVKGFYVWSLMDNFEWDDGYRKRFGLYYTHYDRPEQYLIKDSGVWYAELCRSGKLVRP